ncbi:MAG: preprotein translocase subunit YajC [Lacunisphaera sp.]|jgi:preprotein translocase subunit YajC|nr:preprotein translocase subunit YajC [Lacunisphaera sp.]
MTKIHLFLAQAPAAAPQQGGASSMFLMLGYGLLMIALFWFMTSSQRKKQKEHEKMIKELKSGDEVITTGGIYGTITGVKDDRFVVRIGDNNAKVELAKGFVTSVVKKSDAS